MVWAALKGSNIEVENLKKMSMSPKENFLENQERGHSIDPTFNYTFDMMHIWFIADLMLCFLPEKKHSLKSFSHTRSQVYLRLIDRSRARIESV